MKAYLFDWGDTLMVDFPQFRGKMCDWPTVEAIEGAQQTLAHLSVHNTIYIATGADDSSELDIKTAFKRAKLDQYISGYFCKHNLGVGKSSPEFFGKILTLLSLPASSVTMVGDNIAKDIIPALKEGIEAVWFNPQSKPLTDHKTMTSSVHQIKALTELMFIEQ